jgi:hypothetical protein
MLVRAIVTAFSITAIALDLLDHAVSAEIKGKLVSTTMIVDRASINCNINIARFRDQWTIRMATINASI